MAHFILSKTPICSAPEPTKTETIAYGVRNCMGVGGSKDYFWAAPQEGTWTPASAIIEVNQESITEIQTRKKIFLLPSALFLAVWIIQPVAWWKSTATNGDHSKVHT